MNKTIITAIAILCVSINSVFASSINFKKLNNPGYQNQLKARYDMHKMSDNCYISDNGSDMLIVTENTTIAYIGKKCYLDSKRIHFNNGKLKFTNFDFERKSVPLLKDTIEMTVEALFTYNLYVDTYIKYMNLRKEIYGSMESAYEMMDKTASVDEETYRAAKESFDTFSNQFEEVHACVLDCQKHVDESKVRVDSVMDLLIALIECRGNLNGK